MKCCMSTDVEIWKNQLTFEPDPDYSPDAGTGLLSAISYDMRCNAEFYYSGKIPRIWGLAIGRPSLQRRVVLKRFYSPRAVGTTLSEVHALYRVPYSFRYASPRLWNQLPDSFRQLHQSCLDSPPHPLVNPSLSSSPLSSSIRPTPSLFHSRLKTYLFHKSFPP